MRSATIQGAAGLAVKGESMADGMRGAAIKSAAGLAVKVESRAVGMRGATIERARGATGLVVEVKTMLGIDARASTEYRSGLQNGNVVQKKTTGQRSRRWQRVKEFIKEVDGKIFKFQKTKMICN